MAGKVKNYSDDLKKQIVALRESGKTVSSIVKEYGIAKSIVTKWTTDYANWYNILYICTIGKLTYDYRKLRKASR